MLLAFVAVALVMAQRYQPRFLFFPAHTFHLGLLFFTAGHLATVRRGAREKLLFLRSELWTKLGLFYAVNALAAAATLLLVRAGHPPGGPVPSLATGGAALSSLGQFLLAPFGAGEGYALLQPGWILVQLFVVSVCFQLACVSTHRLYLGGLMLAALLAALALLGEHDASASGPLLLAGRTAFAGLFYLFGYLIKTSGERVRKRLTAPAVAVWGFLAVDALAAHFGNLAYRLELGSLGNARPLVPLLTTAALVVLLYQLANYAARVVGERSALLEVGRASLAILLCLSSLCFAADALVRSDNLNRTWLLSVVPALALPVLGQRALGRLLKRPLRGVLA